MKQRRRGTDSLLGREGALNPSLPFFSESSYAKKTERGVNMKDDNGNNDKDKLQKYNPNALSQEQYTREVTAFVARVKRKTEGMNDLQKNIERIKAVREIIGKTVLTNNEKYLPALPGYLDKELGVKKSLIRNEQNLIAAIQNRRQLRDFDEQCGPFLYADGIGYLRYCEGVFQPVHNTGVSMLLNVYSGLLGATQKAKKAVLEELKSDPDVYIGDASALNPNMGIVNLRNAVFDTGEYRAMEHSPVFRSTVQLDFPYIEDADCPTWKKFINGTFTEPETRLFVQQYVGACISSVTLPFPFLLLTGAGRERSVFVNVLKKLIGEGFHTKLCLKNLGIQKNREALKRLRANFCAVGKSEVIDFSVFDAIMNEAESAAASSCKLIFIPTARLKFSDFTAELREYIRAIKFIKTLTGNPVEFEGMIEDELPGIFNWAVEGLKALRAEGCPVESATMAEEAKYIQDTNSPVKLFLVFLCEIGPTFEELLRDIVQKYNEFARKHGFPAKSEDDLLYEINQYVEVKRVKETFRDEKIEIIVRGMRMKTMYPRVKKQIQGDPIDY